LNLDFAVKIVVRALNIIKISVAGYFLTEEVVNYFKVIKYSYLLSCGVVGCCNRLIFNCKI